MSQGKFKPNREDHPDVKIRDVLAQAPNGEWLRFDTLLEAKILLLPNYHKSIFHSFEDFELRVSPGAKIQLSERFGSQSLRYLWDQLQATCRNPYRKHEAMAATDEGYRGLAKRVRRPRILKYRFNMNAKDQRNVDAFYRLPPQAQSLVQLIEEYVKSFTEPVVLETELKTYIEKNAEKLATKQDPWRIFQYYRGRLIASGFLRFTR